MLQNFHQYIIYASEPSDEQPVERVEKVERKQSFFHHRAFHSNVENTNKLNRVPSSQEMLQVLEQKMIPVTQKKERPRLKSTQSTELLYERQMNWLSEVQKKKTDTKNINDKTVDQECTFKPKIKDKSPFFKGQRQMQRDNSYKQLYTKKTCKMR